MLTLTSNLVFPHLGLAYHQLGLAKPTSTGLFVHLCSRFPNFLRPAYFAIQQIILDSWQLR